ncbi:hypothetical protein GCM10011351_16330 [Paraliobacillus quinghaiensis]|uniref:Endolytic murein transglycosylase n=1 Tax=Paraliobacillus quinghaiensis TaxID=470815 RepID=A0A917TNX9_9BACI|nr:endolytic transglycosylase MltG [Paraliobacillus quinghaiensis]GGM30966.1 hypothetical protein GCM10011351_16330 [Paraliobacillus quinghaiensis]
MSKSTQENENQVQEHQQANTYSKSERFIKRCQEASLVRKIVFTIVILLTIILVVGGMSGYRYVKQGLEPVDKNADTTIEVEIPMGSSTSAIASILEENGVINNDLFYRFYVKFNNNATGFQAGEYTLSPSMTLAEITDELQTGTVVREPIFNVTIPEGKTIEQIATIYEQNADIEASEFIEKMQDQEYIEHLIQTYPALLSDELLDDDIRFPLEGYLFAATYPFYEEEPSIDTIVYDMLEKSEQVVLSYISQINELEQWNVHDVVTLASLVENEARTEEDREKIAGVFFNRLEKDMRLETDPTVLYALGGHKERVLLKDLEVESPYNTYHVKGLPVGPISNFSESSLKSVLEPEDTNYLFFVAAPDGEIYYAETFAEHLKNAEKYLDRDV